MVFRAGLLSSKQMVVKNIGAKSIVAKPLISKQLIRGIVCCFLMFNMGICWAEKITKEYKIKSAYIFNLTKFTHWPDKYFKDDYQPINICFSVENPMEKFFSKMVRGKKVGDKKRALKSTKTHFQDLTTCEMVFISQDSVKYQHLEVLKGCQCLVVGDSPLMTEYGSDLNFYLVEDKVRIEINVESVKAKGIAFSSELMAFAKLNYDA